MTPSPDIIAERKGDLSLTLKMTGRLDAEGVARLWTRAGDMAENVHGKEILIDLAGADYLDTAGAALVSFLKRSLETRGSSTVTLTGLSPDAQRLVALSDRAQDLEKGPETKPKAPSLITRTGALLQNQLESARDFIAFSGDIARALGTALIHPKRIRWNDALVAAEKAGVNALPIVGLISFIVGLVMAFQAAIPMKMFGAEIYVANLIGIAMVRELGPLMTAIILAGRSGSAFAAEIGTMKINEEVDALTTMGLDPVMFLMVPRILAAVFITPLLTVFSNFIGIFGGSIVLISMDYPMITYYRKVITFVSWEDLAGGMIKCFVFGILIAATGCIRGFQTRSGPSAVGTSTTSAVVTGIVLIAVFDGIFSVLYYCLGI